MRRSALVAIGARYYDPTLGRFISVDPVMDLTDPAQWHGYAYANNNPLAYVDPTGLAPDKLVGDWDGATSNKEGGGPPSWAPVPNSTKPPVNNPGTGVTTNHPIPAKPNASGVTGTTPAGPYLPPPPAPYLPSGVCSGGPMCLADELNRSSLLIDGTRYPIPSGGTARDVFNDCDYADGICIDRWLGIAPDYGASSGYVKIGVQICLGFLCVSTGLIDYGDGLKPYLGGGLGLKGWAVQVGYGGGDPGPGFSGGLSCNAATPYGGAYGEWLASGPINDAEVYAGGGFAAGASLGCSYDVTYTWG